MERPLGLLLLAVVTGYSGLAQSAPPAERATVAAPVAPTSLRWNDYTLTDVRRVAVAPDAPDELRLPVDTGQRGDAWAVLDGVAFSDGEISFEFRNIPPANSGHIGVALRVSADAKRFDTLYFSPALSPSRVALKPDDTKSGKAVKHVPVTNGEVRWWDYLKPAYLADAEIGEERWIKVRIRVQGDRVEIYVDDTTTPTTTFTLEGNPAEQRVALWCHAATRTMRLRHLKIAPAAP